MDLQSFIFNFAFLFDESDASDFFPETQFHNLDEWSSLNALAIMNMINMKYGIHISPEEMRIANTIQELFDLVKSKK